MDGEVFESWPDSVFQCFRGYEMGLLRPASSRARAARRMSAMATRTSPIVVKTMPQPGEGSAHLACGERATDPKQRAVLPPYSTPVRCSSAVAVFDLPG